MADSCMSTQSAAMLQQVTLQASAMTSSAADWCICFSSDGAEMGKVAQRRDPKTSEEEEYLENLFDTLCTCLMQPKTRTLFFEAEGAVNVAS